MLLPFLLQLLLPLLYQAVQYVPRPKEQSKFNVPHSAFRDCFSGSWSRTNTPSKFLIFNFLTTLINWIFDNSSFGSMRPSTDINLGWDSFHIGIGMKPINIQPKHLTDEFSFISIGEFHLVCFHVVSMCWVDCYRTAKWRMLSKYRIVWSVSLLYKFLTCECKLSQYNADLLKFLDRFIPRSHQCKLCTSFIEFCIQYW